MPPRRDPQILAVCATLLALASLTASATSVFPARAVRVLDGDSLRIEAPDGAPREIRLEGIDCPEVGQRFADDARDFTRDFVRDRELEVRGSVSDEHGRLLSRILVDGRDLSLALVRAGLAWHYKRYSRDAKLAEAEDAARAARVGLWSDATPVAPWDFRARRRTHSPAAGAGGYVGNVRSLLFHAASCVNASCANCVKRFESREAAVAAGYRPARCCHR